MAYHESRAEQQVKSKIKAFNKQRAGLPTIFIILIGIFVFSPATEAQLLSVQLSMFCSVILFQCGAAS